MHVESVLVVYDVAVVELVRLDTVAYDIAVCALDRVPEEVGLAAVVRVADNLEVCDRGDLGLRSGKFGGIEIKSGSGAVAYAETDGMNNYINPFTKEDCVAENVLPKAKLIIWYPWGNMALNSGTPFKYGWVFTREQFIDTLTAIGKNGLASSLKISKNGGQINIQTITAKLEDRLYDYLENIPSVEEYFGE